MSEATKPLSDIIHDLDWRAATTHTDRAAWLPIQPKTLLGAIYAESDRGPWRAEVDPLMGHARIVSDDASHDVVLRVDGNFKTLDEKRAYTEDIARRLNDNMGPLRV